MAERNKLLLTGVSSGVGAFLMKELSKTYFLIGCSRSATKISLNNKLKEHVDLYDVDLREVSQVSVFAKDIVKKYGPIPYLVNNAGVLVKREMDKLTVEDIGQSCAVNAISPFLLSQALLKNMAKNNFGRIVNLTSGAPFNCFKEFGAYSSSKAMLNALTITFANELKDKNIKINLMSPGPVKTKMAPNATMHVRECMPTLNHLLELDENGPSGRFFWLGKELPCLPNLEGVNWLKGTASEGHKRIF